MEVDIEVFVGQVLPRFCKGGIDPDNPRPCVETVMFVLSESGIT